MTQPCTSPTVFGQQCSEKFVTLLAGRPLGGQLQLSTPTHSPENPCVASTPAMEVVVHAPSSTPRVATSASKYGAVSLEKDKTKLTSYSLDVPKTLAECNRQLFTVKQGIGGLVAISSPATSCSKYNTGASMQSTPIHPTNMSSPCYSFPVVMSPFASYATPVATNIFEDSLLKESPDLEMLSEVALQISPSAAHRNFLLRHHQHVTAASPDEDENDASRSLSYIQRNHVPCILRKRKSYEHDVGTSPSFSTDERKAFEEHSTCQQGFSPSMLLNVPLLHHQKSDYHKTKKKKRKSLEKSGRSFIASTPIRDGKTSTFSPLTKSHDVVYDSYRDSGYLTRIESHSGIYGSPGAYYDQQPSVKELASFHDSNLRASIVNPEWESYDENLMPSRKLKPSPSGSALKPVRPSEVFRDCRELSSEEFLHRYVLVQAIEKAKSGHYMKKSRFAPDWARFVYGLTDEQLEVTALAKQFLLKTQNRFL